MNQNKKALIILVIVLLVFGGFLTFILSSSPISSAVKKIRDCTSITEIKTAYQSIENTQVRNNETFIKEVRDKINSYQPNEAQLNDCIDWLPARPISINLVIVPDLSRRIVDTLNCPNQINLDRQLLKGIWSAFKDATKKKRKSKDKLAIDVTDCEQGGGTFAAIANNSIFSLSDNDPALINEFYFDKKDESFNKLVDTLYNLAKEKQTSGADYWNYLDHALYERHNIKSTIYDEIQNKVILVTDGYLEFDHNDTFTRVNMNAHEHPIKKGNANYSNWSVLVCEVRERKQDEHKGAFNKLKIYWGDWLTAMNFNNVTTEFFIESNPATSNTVEKIREFIGASNSTEKKIVDNVEPSTITNQVDQSMECLNNINLLISGKQNITAENIEELVNVSLEKCNVDKIVIDDGILRRSLKGFLLSKSKEAYKSTEISIENKILTVKAQKQ